MPYVAAVVAGALAAIAVVGAWDGFTQRLSWFLALLALSLMGALGRPQAIGSISISASGIVQLTAIPLVGPMGAAIVGAVPELAAPREPIKRIFNAAQRVLLVLAGGVVYRMLGGGPLGIGQAAQSDVLDLAWRLGVATLMAALANAALVAGVLTFSSAGSFRAFVVDLIKQAIPAYAMYGVAAYALAVLWAPSGLGWVSAIFFFPSLYVIQWALAQHAAVWSTRHEVLNPFVVALDERYPGTKRESELVADAATAIANTLGIKPGDVDRVAIAAQIRDVGMLALDSEPEAIQRRDHAGATQRVLSGISFLQGPLGLVVGHHERVDGQGWPQGLSGGSIPLGARILAVAETWADRLLETRDPEAAVIRCETLVGTGLDAACVAALRRAHERGRLPVAGAARRPS